MNYEQMWRTLQEALEIRIAKEAGTELAEHYADVLELMEFIEKRNGE